MILIKKIFLVRFIASLIIGAVGGYAYYYFIGCSSGSCPLTSNPVIMTLYGLIFGGVLGFKKRKQAPNS